MAIRSGESLRKLVLYNACICSSTCLRCLLHISFVVCMKARHLKCSGQWNKISKNVYEVRMNENYLLETYKKDGR